MDRINSLNVYQKCILIVMLAAVLIFSVIYPVTISKSGFLYRDTILVPTEENGNTVYSGKIQGEETAFIVSENTVAFRHGSKDYGLYILKEDPTAIPKKEDLADRMTGIEISNGNRILFRGGVIDAGDSYWLYNEDGTLENLVITYVSGDGIEWDDSGNKIDKMEPTASTIYELLNDPELTHKGEAMAWFGAVLTCIFNAVSILYADELFRWNLLFRIRNAEYAEPSDWEITSRYIGWTLMAVMVFVIFIMGLQ